MKNLLILFLFISTSCFCQIPKLDENKRVFDFENNFQNTNQIEQTIFSLEKELNVKIVLITTSDFFGQATAFDAIQEITKVNTIGDNSGFILLLSKNKRRTELQVSRKVEGYLPDIYCKRITDTGNSYFKKGQYDDGILRVLQELKTYLKPEKIQTEIVQNNQQYEKEHQIDFGWLWNILGILFATVLGFFGWSKKIEKDKEKAYQLEQERRNKIFEKKRLIRIEELRIQTEESKLKCKTFKEENSLKLIYFEEKMKSIKDFVNKDFKVSNSYFEKFDSKITNFKFFYNDNSEYNYLNLEIIKNLVLELTNLDYQDIFKELSNKKFILKSNLDKLQNLYNSAKSTIEENQSQYFISDLEDSKFQNCFDESFDLLEREKNCSELISKYDKIIRCKEIKKREDELAEYNRQLQIKQESDRKRKEEQDEIDRIARKKIQDKKDEDNRNISISTSYSNDNSSNSFGSISNFGGGGSGSDW